MATGKDFHLYKWYADVIDKDTGNVTIVYLGELQWKFFKISFTNVLQFLQKRTLLSRATFLNYRPPVVENKSFVINSPKLSGRWETDTECISEMLYEAEAGYILWECFMPRASAQILVDGKTTRGVGYVERLTMTLKPWQMPIDVLRWGRFLCDNHSIIWIRWEGEEQKVWIFHNRVKYLDGLINDEHVKFGRYHLTLEDKYTLRNGPLIKTVFDEFVWVKKIFPAGLLHMNECKWQTWSELHENGRPIAEGWSIHENVECKSKLNTFGKVFYGSLFTILLPVLLIFWAKQTKQYIQLPMPANFAVAVLLFSLGMVLILVAMLELWFRGHGLPMNAYPPPKLVTKGVYKIVPHPIYIGGSLVCVGASMYYQSKSGFWLVSPVLTLAWLALVHGYENEDLKKRFPRLTWHTLVDLPANVKLQCQFKDRIAAYCLVLLPWLVLYQTIIFIGSPAHSISTYLPFESDIPVIEWTEILYLLAYPYVALLPLVLQTKQQMRSFIIDGLLNVGIGIYLQLILPLVAVPRDFVPQMILGRILVRERELDGPTAAFPSFHVSWAFLSARYYTWILPKHKLTFYVLASLISASCITTGMHSIIDVVAGYGLFLICLERERLWVYLRNYFERLANSWCAYRIGHMRIMNHSFYTFVSASTGAFIIFSLLDNIYAMLLVSLSSLTVAALWAQLVEGSSGLSRPFGYFGCIAGGMLGSMAASQLFVVPVLSILAAFTLASPWLQGTGRLRCVIQGCCHGRPTNRFLGISVSHPRSRVCSLSQLRSTPIHLTQAYSMLANILIGMLLWRLWYSNTPLGLIVSLYFILIGLSRFVEERFRGEIQTLICHQLTIYQWTSIAFVLIGVFVSMIPCDEQIRLNLAWKYEYGIPSVIVGLAIAIAMGVDFPDSSKKFSRLSD